jgi:hypothetical protein
MVSFLVTEFRLGAPIDWFKTNYLLSIKDSINNFKKVKWSTKILVTDATGYHKVKQ